MADLEGGNSHLHHLIKGEGRLALVLLLQPVHRFLILSTRPRCLQVEMFTTQDIWKMAGG